MAASENRFSGVLKRSLSDTAEALSFTDENNVSSRCTKTVNTPMSA